MVGWAAHQRALVAVILLRHRELREHRAGFQAWASRIWDLHFVVMRLYEADAYPERRASDWYFSLGDWLTH